MIARGFGSGGRPAVRVALTVLTLVLLYQLLAGLAATLRLRFPSAPGVRGPLPNLMALERTFAIFGVWGGYGRDNYDWQIVGLARRVDSPALAPEAAFIDLDAASLYPQRRGDVYRRLAFWTYPEAEKPALYRRLCDRIQHAHNRRNPERPVTQVVIFRRRWPRSADGTYARVSEATRELIAHN